MNFQDYEREHYFVYAQYAEVVSVILQKAIEASDSPRPQSIQHRAKSPNSLRTRLEEIDKIASQNIEAERRDLAGVRIIFYTNTDVERFLGARLIFENFELERDATRIHHPTLENDERRYRAIHYTVTLTEDRAKLPEYLKFKDMRCEIQIQTILNHSWSETSHDIAYKNKPREGFGTRAMDSIKSRLDKIMDKYLLPAGYEFQRVQHDYERLQQGKELFDQDIISALQSASDNNERHTRLTSLKDQVLPNYDDVAGVYRDLIDPLISAAQSARATAPKPIETPFGELKGKTSEDITKLVIEIFEMLRYVDVEQTFSALCRLFPDEKGKDTKKRTLDAATNLAKYDFSVWNKAGAFVQSTLVEAISSMGVEKRESVRPIIVAVLQSVLKPDITGTTWKADSVTWSTGSLPASHEIKAIRGKAIAILFELFRSATNDVQRRGVKSALREATHITSRAETPNDFLRMTISDGVRIAEFLAAEASKLSYELKETIEYNWLFDYQRAKPIAGDDKERFGCRDEANALMAAIINLRDQINADPKYVRYKTLVGYEVVFNQHWDDEPRDYRELEAFRTREAKRFVAEITDDTEDEWFAFIERCSATKSNDGATFPIFGKFLHELAQSDPSRVIKLLSRANSDLLSFLPPILNGLYESKDRELYESCINGYLEAGTHLASMAFHWRRAKPAFPNLIKAILDKGISTQDDRAVSECLVFAIENAPAQVVPANDEFSKLAIKYLTSKKNTYWIFEAWVMNTPSPFFESLATDEVNLILENLLDAPKIDYHIERILSEVGRKHLPLVWDFFGARLTHKADENDEERYEAIPYDFHGLEKILSSDVKAAVSVTRKWYAADAELFRYRAGRLLSSVFPKFDESISKEFCDLVTNGTSDDADFVIEIMENYKGETATHEVLKRIVAKYPSDENKLGGVRVSFDNTGVVSGEFGLVEAIRLKKKAIEPWLNDSRKEVRTFAENHLQELDLRIADEQRRAEQRKALRNLDFEEDDTKDDNKNKNREEPKDGDL